MHWDYPRGRGLDDVRREAQRSGRKVHFARMAEPLPEKNAELPRGTRKEDLKADVFYSGTGPRIRSSRQQCMQTWHPRQQR